MSCVGVGGEVAKLFKRHGQRWFWGGEMLYTSTRLFISVKISVWQIVGIGGVTSQSDYFSWVILVVASQHITEYGAVFISLKFQAQIERGVSTFSLSFNEIKKAWLLILVF